MRNCIVVYCELWDVLVLVIITHEKSVCLLVKSHVKSICSAKGWNYAKECL